MYQLIVINIAIIMMDIALLSIEYASLYLLETIMKGFTYSLKLKLEFTILSRLINFVGGDEARGGSIAPVRSHSKTVFHSERAQGLAWPTAIREASSISEFVDLSKVNTDYRYACPNRGNTFSGSLRIDCPETDILEDNAMKD